MRIEQPHVLDGMLDWEERWRLVRDRSTRYGQSPDVVEHQESRKKSDVLEGSYYWIIYVIQI